MITTRPVQLAMKLHVGGGSDWKVSGLSCLGIVGGRSW